MKPVLMGIALVLMAGWICAVPAESTNPVEALFPDPAAPAPAAEIRAEAAPGENLQTETRLRQMQKQIDALEARLGGTSRPPSVAYNVERRLADLEKRMQQLEQQLTRLQQVDQRIRRLETK